MPGAAASSPDIAAIATNLGVFALAIMAAVGGIYRGLKNAREGKPAPGDKPLPAGVIIESHSMILWSESNKEVKVALEALLKAEESHTRSNHRLADEMKDLCHEMEMLRVTLDRRK